MLRTDPDLFEKLKNLLEIRCKKQAEVIRGIASVSILLEERLKKEAEVKKIIGKIKLRLPGCVASAVIFKKGFVKIHKIDLTKKKKEYNRTIAVNCYRK